MYLEWQLSGLANGYGGYGAYGYYPGYYGYGDGYYGGLGRCGYGGCSYVYWEFALRRRISPVQAIKAAKFEDRYDALVELLNQEQARAGTNGRETPHTCSNAHFTVI